DLAFGEVSGEVAADGADGMDLPVIGLRQHHMLPGNLDADRAVDEIVERGYVGPARRLPPVIGVPVYADGLTVGQVATEVTADAEAGQTEQAERLSGAVTTGAAEQPTGGEADGC